MDKETLDAQVAAKKAAAKAEKELNQHYGAVALSFDQQLTMLEQTRIEAKKAMNKEVAAYRAAEQGRHLRREYDLSDPKTLLNDRPARVGDDDARCGASSMQRFDGEDLGASAREAAQMRQHAEWALQQMREKEARAAAEKTSLDTYGNLLLMQEAAQDEFAARVAAQRKAAAKATADYVAGQIAERKAHKEAERAAEQSANAAEQESVSNSLFMTENPITGVSSLSATRVRTDHWKGMNAAQMADIRAAQDAQRSDLAGRRKAEQNAAAEYASYADSITSRMSIASQEVEMRKRQARLEIAAAQRQQIEEKQQRDEHLKQVYTNKPDDSFFAQFGTTHR